MKESILLAIKKIIRSPVQSILLLLMFFIIGNFLFSGLGIFSASEQTKILMRQKMNPIVKYNFDSEKAHNEAMKAYENGLGTFQLDITEYITEENVFKLASDNRVIAINSLTESPIAFVGLEPVISLENLLEDSQFRVTANYFDDMVEFHNGNYRLEDGRFYNQEEIDQGLPVVLISKELSELNNIHIGDSVKMQAVFVEAEKEHIAEELQSIELEVIGIFTSRKEEIRPHTISDLEENNILMPSTTFTDYYKKVYDALYVDYYAKEIWHEEAQTWRNIYHGVNNTLLLNDPIEVENFIRDHSDLINEYAFYDINNDIYESLSSPLDSISQLAMIVVAVISAVSLIIISLISALTFKTREYEVGVLLSMGIKKIHILLQLFLELAIIAGLGFILSYITGNMLAQKLGGSILNVQVKNAEIADSVVNNDYFNEVTTQDLIENYEVKVEGIVIVESLGIGILVILISISFLGMMLMKLDPKKIMMNTQ